MAGFRGLVLLWALFGFLVVALRFLLVGPPAWVLSPRPAQPPALDFGASVVVRGSFSILVPPPLVLPLAVSSVFSLISGLAPWSCQSLRLLCRFVCACGDLLVVGLPAFFPHAVSVLPCLAFVVRGGRWHPCSVLSRLLVHLKVTGCCRYLVFSRYGCSASASSSFRLVSLRCTVLRSCLSAMSGVPFPAPPRCSSAFLPPCSFPIPGSCPCCCVFLRGLRSFPRTLR